MYNALYLVNEITESEEKGNMKRRLSIVVLGMLMAFTLAGCRDNDTDSSTKKTEVSDEKGVFNDTGALGVIVEGKYYAFSLEEGIENYYDIEDSYYYTISLNFFSYDKNGTEVAVSDEPRTYYTGGRNDDYAWATVSFDNDCEWEIDEINSKSKESEINKKYYFTGGTTYQMNATDEGNMDMEAIKADISNVKNGGASELPYYKYLPDRVLCL